MANYGEMKSIERGAGTYSERAMNGYESKRYYKMLELEKAYANLLLNKIPKPT